MDGGLHRHEDVGYAQVCHRAENGRIFVGRLLQRRIDHARDATLAHVVDDVGSHLLYYHSCHVGTVGIDRENGLGLLAAHDGQGEAQAAHLLLRYLHAAWAGGEATHVDHGAALLDDLVGTAGDALLGLYARPGEKRVGRAVEDSHDLRFTKADEPPLHLYCIFHVSVLFCNSGQK